MQCPLLFLGLTLLLCSNAAAGAGTFRTGLVLDASNQISFDRLRGFSFFLKVFSRKHPEGILLGDPSSVQYAFDFSMEVNNKVFEEQKGNSLSQLLDGGGDEGDGAHFLFGVEADEAAAAASGAFAERRKRVMLHCCAEDNAFAGRRWEYFFTMIPSYRNALSELGALAFVKTVKKVAIVYENGVSYFENACQSIAKQQEDNSAVEVVLAQNASSKELGSASSIKRIVEETIASEAEAFIGCTGAVAAKSLINEFWDKKYALKLQAYTDGPSRKSFAKSLGERAHGVMGISLVHRTASFHDEDFFGTFSDFLDKFGDEEDIDYGIAMGAGSFYALFKALQFAFADCDISGSEGNADSLLFNEASIRCSDNKNNGYERVRLALRFLSITNSIVGPIDFNKYNQNNRAGSPTLVTQVQTNRGSTMEPVTIAPLNFRANEPNIPVRNPFVPAECVPGQFMSDDLFQPCVPCPPGTISSDINVPACSLCLANTYSAANRTTCVPCPDNSFAFDEGSASVKSCKCGHGFYNLANLANETSRFLRCEKCPEGALCNGHNALPIPQAGFWALPSYPADVHECESSDRCPRGFECGTSNGNPKYTGRLCDQCAAGFFKVMGNCFQCIGPARVTFLILGLYTAWFFINSVVSTLFESFEMLLTWVQLVNIVGSLNLDWPRSLVQLFGFTSLLDFDVDAVEPDCLWKNWDHRSNFLVQLLLPVCLSALAFLRFATYYWQYKKKVLGLRKGSNHEENCNWMMEKIGFRVPSRRADDWLADKLDEAIAHSLQAVDLTYLTITRYCFEAIGCETIAGVEVMKASVNIECSSKEHTQLRIMSGFGFVFYTMGYLGFVTHRLMYLHFSRKYQERSNIQRYGYLYERFELGYSFMAVQSLLARILFVAFSLFFDDPKAAAAAMGQISVVYLLIIVYTAPYVNSSLDFLQTCLSVGLLVVSFSGVLFSTKPLHPSFKLYTEYSALTLCGIMTLVIGVVTIREIIIKTRLAFIQKLHRRAVLSSLPQDIDLSLIEHDIVVSGSVDKELYSCLDANYLYHWLKNADQSTLLDFDKLSIMMSPFLSEDSYTSYLSQEAVAQFWRKLVTSFPEIVDYLLVVDDENREHFCRFSYVLYRAFYLRHRAKGPTFHGLIDWKDRGALAQWLAMSPKEDRSFFGKTVLAPFRKLKGLDGVPVHEVDKDLMDKFICDTLMPCRRGTRDVPENRPSLFKMPTIQVSVDQKAALKELEAGRGPLHHDSRSLDKIGRSELCAFARQMTLQAPSRLNRSSACSKEKQDAAGKPGPSKV